jgi:hypothetical protein
LERPVYHEFMKSPVDTTADVEQILIRGYRAMPVWEKFQQIVDLSDFVNNLALAEIGRRHPSASDRERRLYLCSRWLDPSLLLNAFGWDVTQKGF